MKRISVIIALLLMSCGNRQQQTAITAESETQFNQFQDYMLFDKGEQDAAIESLFKSAESGNTEAQLTLAACYADRPDLIKREKSDIDSAVIWWFKAAIREDDTAQHELASYYAKKQDWTLAKLWLNKAKKNGYKDKELQKEINKHL